MTKNVIVIVVKDIRNYEIWTFAFAMSRWKGCSTTICIGPSEFTVQTWKFNRTK
jgi:hypothetical protein